MTTTTTKPRHTRKSTAKRPTEIDHGTGLIGQPEPSAEPEPSTEPAPEPTDTQRAMLPNLDATCMWTPVPLVMVWLIAKGGLTTANELLDGLYMGKPLTPSAADLLADLELHNRGVAQRLAERLAPPSTRH